MVICSVYSARKLESQDSNSRQSDSRSHSPNHKITLQLTALSRVPGKINICQYKLNCLKRVYFCWENNQRCRECLYTWKHSDGRKTGSLVASKAWRLSAKLQRTVSSTASPHQITEHARSPDLLQLSRAWVLGQQSALGFCLGFHKSQPPRG